MSPGDGRSRPGDRGGSRAINHDDAPIVAQQLHRRAEAARGADPWTADQQDWRDRWDVLMARLGWAPKWQQERARQLWEAGVR